MANRMVEPALVLGLVSALALSTAAPSFGQTQRQRPSAQEQGLGKDQVRHRRRRMRRSARRRRAHNPAIRRPLSSPVRAGSPPTRTLASATGARAPIKGRAQSNSGSLHD